MRPHVLHIVMKGVSGFFDYYIHETLEIVSNRAEAMAFDTYADALVVRNHIRKTWPQAQCEVM